MPRIAPHVRFWSVTFDESTNLSWTSFSASQNTPMSAGAPAGALGTAPAPEFVPARPSELDVRSEPPTPIPTTKTTRSVIKRASTPPTRSGRCVPAAGGATTHPVDDGEIGLGWGVEPDTQPERGGSAAG